MVIKTINPEKHKNGKKTQNIEPNWDLKEAYDSLSHRQAHLQGEYLQSKNSAKKVRKTNNSIQRENRALGQEKGIHFQKKSHI